MEAQAEPTRLSLEQQVGQVIMGIWQGDLEQLTAQIAQGRLGGLVLPAGAAASLEDLVATLNSLQRLATYPLLCAANLDGAGGPFVPGAGALPGALALGAARQPELARRAGVWTGSQARAWGIHLVLGPVLDVQREPDHLPVDWRSFGSNPVLVARLGAAFVEGCQARRALATGRHFPGRGAAIYDAQRHQAIVPLDRAALAKADLQPYVEACHAGLGAIMTAHLHVAALDSLPTRLATHSSAVVQGLLRRTLAYRGLVLTDNLDAGELSSRYGPGEAAILAFAAGHDLLVTEHPEQVFRALYEVLLHGDIPAARLHEALGRIWAAKEWLGLFRNRFAEPATDDEGQELAAQVARASLTAVRGKAEVVAGRPVFLCAAPTARLDGTRVDQDLARLARERFAQATFHTLAPGSACAGLDQAVASAGDAAAAILFVDLPPQADPATGTMRGEALAALTHTLKSLGLPLAVVVLGNPYALPHFPEADLLLHAPSNLWPCLEAACAYLAGHGEAPGRLPVSVPGISF